MKILAVSLLALLSLCQPNWAQNRREYPQRPEAADRISLSPTASKPKYRIDPVQLQRQAKEILELTQSLQPEINDVSRGLMPKDTAELLKKIESLAKQMRNEIRP